MAVYDSYYEWVTLLLHGDGADAATVITDSSQFASSPSAQVGIITSTAQSKFGGSSIKVPTTKLLKFTDARFTMDTDWTLEGWFYITGSAVHNFFYLGETEAVNRTKVYSSGYADLAIDTFGVYARSFPVPSIPNNAWFHLAVCKQGSNWTAYLNGAPGAATGPAPAYHGNGGIQFISGGAFDMYVEDVRITRYVARYTPTTTFIPPTEAYGTDNPSTILLTAPKQTLSFSFGAVFTLTALTAPKQQLAMFTGLAAALTNPRPSIDFIAHDATGERVMLLTAPLQTLVMRGGMAALLRAPKQQVTMALTGQALLTMNLTAPLQQLTASATNTGLMELDLRAPLSSLIAYSGTVILVSGPMGTIQVSATGGAVGQILATCPLFDLVMTGTAQSMMEFDLLSPLPQMGQGRMQAWMFAPMGELVLTGFATVTATYEAWALNLKHQPGYSGPEQASHYTNFPFAYIVRHANSYYGVASSGVYLLEGTTDYATPTPLAITWDWRTGLSDFGRGNKKIPDAVYIGGRMGPASTITLGVGESSDLGYAFTTPRGAIAQNYRQKFGKGLKQNYYSLGISGDGDLAIDYLNFLVSDLPRRI